MKLISIVRRRLPLLLLCLPFGIFVGDAIATAPPYEPIDFRPPALLVKAIRQAKSFFTPAVPTDVLLPTQGRKSAPFQSPWVQEREFGNSVPTDNSAASSGGVLQEEGAVSGDSAASQEMIAVSDSALQGGTMAMLSGLPTVAGRIASTFGVSQTGTASYTIPVWTPPGARGIEPKLALVYASGAPDSLLGPGWSLEGLSTIARCNKTWVQDGAPAPVALTTADRFCLDGNRLRLTGGTYGSAGSTYQTELETFSKVTANGAAGNGPQWFEVKGKDGLIYEYGNTTDSRVYGVGGATPYLWALNKVRDRQGNNLLISYLQTNGSFRPSIIYYTQTPTTSTTYNYQVVFGYTTRAAAANITQYVAGGKVQQTYVLTGITAQTVIPVIGAITVRQYNIDYATAPATQQPRVSAVQTCTTTDCLKPTTIAYQDGSAGIASPTTSVGTGTTSGQMNTVDLDGDGRQDLVYAVPSGTTRTWHVKFATAGGFGAAVSIGLTTNSSDIVLYDDFLSEGKVSMLAPQSGIWYSVRWNGSAFTLTSTGLTVDAGSIAAGGYYASADINGDSRPDLICIHTDAKVYSRLNTSSGTTVSFSSSQTLALTAPYPRQILGVYGNNQFPASSVRYMDFDGDGKGDAAALIYYPSNPYGSPIYYAPLISLGTTFALFDPFGAFGTTFLPANLNNDSCTDIFAATFAYAWGCNGSSGQSIAYSSPATLAADYDGDGRTDVWYNSGGVFQVRRSQGDSLGAAFSTGISAGSGIYQSFDQDGDGLDDLAYANSGASYAVSYGVHNGAGVRPDLATSFTDGFEMNVSFGYKPMSAVGAGICYYRDSAAPAFPARAFMGALYTACTMTASNGIGGTYQVAHSYYNINIHLQGRGLLGFERHYSIDNRNGIINMDSYGQSFPYIGITLYSLARQSDWTTKIREIANTPATLSFGSGFDTRSFPYISQTLDDAFEAGGTLNGQWITRTTTSTSPDSYGNPTTVTVATTDKSTASPYYGETYSVQTANTITNDTTNWCLGRPTQTTVQSTLPDSTSQTRTTSAAVDYFYCRNTQEVIEPSSSTLKVTTNYGFDSCGNTNSVSVVGKKPDGADMTTRTTTSNFGTRCQFPESMTNALSQTSTTAYRYDLGVPSSMTDPNSIAVSWFYDGYGRKTQENRPDGTTTTWTFYICDSSNSYCIGAPDLRWEVAETLLNSSSGPIRSAYRFFDGFDRERYQEQQNFSGGMTWLAGSYDALGRKQAQYVPVSTGGWHYHLYAYDLLNRPTTDTFYQAGGTFDRQTSVAYEGRKFTFTDAKSNQTIKYSDVRGKLRRVDDPSPGGSTYYTWDHFGSLLTTTDAISAASSATYDIRGFKRTSNDPDAGSWSYTPNSLGEVVSQTDAKSQTTSFDYDLLGRLITRGEAEGASTWTWGTSSAAKNIGKLTSASGPGYSESYVFDSLGRPSTTTYNADVAYQVDYAYNSSTGFLDNVTYPTSTSGYRLRAQYQYQYGILNQIRDYNSPSTVWWQLNAQDARGNPIDEQFANGVHVLANNDDLTGHLNWRTSGNNGYYDNHQNITYEWDKNENLDKRIDVNQSNLTERFYYDALDRLDYSTLNGSTNLDVTLDASGNIAYKSDVGSYTYHATKKHAVTSTSNGWSFSFDANGNMQTGRGNTITWYSYNLPNTVTNGSLTSEFFYTPDRKYWKQNANYSGGYENTIYVGGLMEKVTSSGGTEYRHMLRAGSATVIVARHSSGVNNTYYATQDSLGSSSVVTNSAGTVLVSESFDAYGKRRGSNWTGSPSSGDWAAIANTTRRGYTGHTMADNLNLIHMNGRMYDPVIGRFIQPDPIVQTIEMSQALNPYSYVMNNPLKYVDPSGFSWLSKKLRKIGHFFKKYWKPIVAIAAAALSFGYLAPIASGWLAPSGLCLLPGTVTVGGGILAGSISGAIAGGITGGWKGAAVGLVSGALFGASNAAWSSVENAFGRGLGEAVTSGAIGGGTSEALGGRFQDGFWFGFGASAASSAYQSIVRYRETWRSGGDAVAKSETDPPVTGANNIGTQGGKIANPTFWQEGGPASRFLNKVPGINAVAGFHDMIVTNLSQPWRGIFNVPTMIPAAGITTAALVSSTPFQVVYDQSRTEP